MMEKVVGRWEAGRRRNRLGWQVLFGLVGANCQTSLIRATLSKEEERNRFLSYIVNC